MYYGIFTFLNLNAVYNVNTQILKIRIFQQNQQIPEINI